MDKYSVILPSIACMIGMCILWILYLQCRKKGTKSRPEAGESRQSHSVPARRHSHDRELQGAQTGTVEHSRTLANPMNIQYGPHQQNGHISNTEAAIHGREQAVSDRSENCPETPWFTLSPPTYESLFGRQTSLPAYDSIYVHQVPAVPVAETSGSIVLPVWNMIKIKCKIVKVLILRFLEMW